MAHHSKTLVLIPALAMSWVLMSPAAHAQLKLPRHPAERADAKPRGNIAPFLVCLVCNARTYTGHVDGRKDEAGRDLVWCEVCKKDTPHRASVNTDPGLGDGSKPSSGDLRLPRRPNAPTDPTTQPPTTTPTTPPAPLDPNAPKAPDAPPDTNAPGSIAPRSNGGASPTPVDGAVPSNSDTARDATPRRAPASVAAIFEGLRRTKSGEDPAVALAIDDLSSSGEAGLAAARDELRTEDAVRLVVAARVLLRGGDDADIERVETRLRSKLPSAAAVLVDDVVERDPVRAGPEWLVALLDHPQGGVRQTAARALSRSAGPALLPYLEKSAAVKRADTRQHVVEIASAIEDPRATEILLARLDDAAPRVASAAVQAIVLREEAGLDARLLSIAFKDRWVLRRGAYALIALIDREDVRLVPVLEAQHVEPLLVALESSDAFVAGTGATALAGIGFRSRDERHSEWLDRPVMDRLVMTVSGKEFHDDLSSLTTSALRRLRLLTGQSLSGDGPRWVEWWVGVRESFHARRAALPIEPADVGALVVRYGSTVDGTDAFALVGPDAAEQAEAGNESGEIVYLNRVEATDLAAMLAREGLTSAERLPGARGSRGHGERTVEVRSRGRAKSFTFGSEAHEPWFDRAADACLSLRERNRWQRFAESGRHANTLALVREQGDWWSAEHTDAQRDERLKALVLASMRTGSPTQRDACIAELERIGQRPGALAVSDFDALVAAMTLESGNSDRGRRLARLALASGTSSAAVVAGTVGGIGSAGSTNSSGAPGSVTAGSAGSPKSSNTISGAPNSGNTNSGATISNGSVASVAAGGSASNSGADSANAGARRLSDDAAVTLASACCRLPGTNASEALDETLARSRREFVRTLVGDPRPQMRGAVARTLARQPSSEDVTALVKLLDDTDPAVETAAALALGENKVEAARDELLVRARVGLTPVRTASLEAIGRMGGEYVLEALIASISDRDRAVRVAGAKGLAALGDPAAAQVLLSALGEGADSDLFDAARAGLVSMGEKAWPDLIHTVGQPLGRIRREAALILSEQLHPDAVSPLLAILTAAPKDNRVAAELAVLTCIDMRGQMDPSRSWWDWWDGVRHDDATLWFRAALERAGVAPPPPGALEGTGTAQGRLFLVSQMARSEPWLVERARRELRRLIGRDPGELPPLGPERDTFLRALRTTVGKDPSHG